MNDNVQSPWPGPAGLIPVTSGRADDANVFNRSYLDAIHVEMRVIDAVEPSLKTTIFGEEFASPIMMPAFSHLNKVGKDGRKPMQEYARAAKELNTLNWVGMEPDEEYAEITAEGARTVRIIKPFADHSIILNQIRFAIEQGAIAVGVDIDHVPGTDGKYDVVDGIPLGPVMFSDLKAFVKAAGTVPFVAKGVLSVQDAVKCKEAGCQAIIVSHHHGRIPFGIAPLMVLPRIKEALKGSGISIFVDCGIDSGYDAYKALALGADAVAVGRGILKPLLQQGSTGVKEKIQKMNEQLSELMMYTCVKDTRSFDASVLYL
ncbi:alpha-hydroxy-acid oxidizing protein [Prevotella histicola]|uniref:alpha-hydroxy-acid oxidizing protein n=1 Tax=Prevotella histicola TaxID=470565 RepID=UPI00288925C2|nr:alpha-hydroxy-acid oxidizing protein [Prevotella histicola]